VQGLQECYSKEWRELLLWMMTIEEDQRPDFKEVNALLNGELKLYELDDRIPTVYGNTDQRLSVSVQCGLESITLPYSGSEELIPCLISLTANSLPSPNPIDVVCAVDLSGSMEGDWLVLIQHVLVQLIERLGCQDRLSIVGFSEKVHTVCRLTACTNAGKQTLLEITNSLELGDCTNLVNALKVSSAILKKRRSINPQTCMLILSDGKDSFSTDLIEHCKRALHNSAPKGLKVHCFGLGPALNETLLLSLAETYQGVYRPVYDLSEGELALQSAFPALRPSLISDIQVSIQCGNSPIPCKALHLTTDKTAVFPLFSLRAGTGHHLLFRLHPQPIGPIHGSLRTYPVLITVTGKVQDQGLYRKEFPLEVLFVDGSSALPVKVGNVFAHFYYAKACESWAEARISGDMDAARRDLQQTIDYLRGVGEMGLRTQQLIRALKSVNRRI